MPDIGENRANDLLAGLKDKAKEPNSVRVLSSWIDRAERDLGDERSGRIAWLVASTVVAAKLQQVLDASGKPRFVMKGGTMLQHRLGMEARASRDLDGIVTEDLDDFLAKLDGILGEDWGPVSFRRTPAEVIRVPSKVVKPRRFEMVLELRGKVWRRITVEVSPDEGGAGASQVAFEAPRLSAFGLPAPDSLAGIAMSYQIAQKVHACTDPHDPPASVNNRARDITTQAFRCIHRDARSWRSMPSAQAPRGCRARSLPLRCPHGISTAAHPRVGADAGDPASVKAPPRSCPRASRRSSR